MTDAFNLLIVEDDQDSLALLERIAQLREYRTSAAATLADVRRLIASTRFDAALVDLTLGHESGLDAIRALKERDPDTEIVVISGTTSLASAIASYELKAFAFVQKPFDIEQLFGTVERAIEHRLVISANRRLVWEQRLVNEVGDELRHLLAPEQLVERVLWRLMRGLGLDASAARLLNPETSEYDLRVINAPQDVRRVWEADPPLAPRPSDLVLARRAPVRIDDLHAGLAAGSPARSSVRSALSVPMFAGEDLIGVLTVGGPEPGRFTAEDERLLGVIANQVAVGVQNARLHAFVRAGKQEWEATFDAMGDAIAVFDRNGRLLRGNAALAAYLDRPVTSLRGLTCDEIGLCGGSFPECAVGRAAGTACVHDEVTRPGDRIFSVTTCPVLDATDGAAIVQIAKNVTLEIQNARRMRQMSDELAAANSRLVATVDRLKATQAQLLQAEKLSAIGQLVAGVAHELNNPLTSVIGYAQLLQQELQDTPGVEGPRVPELSRDLKRIAEESERAARIVRNLLAFARRQSAARAEQDLNDVMSRVLSLRAYELRLNAIELQTDFAPGLPPVLGDGGQLQQALLNLLLNAEQAMRTRKVRRLHVGTRLVAESGAVEVFIADSGHGIPDENLRRIFDPFFTTREVGEGTGLGLSICYGIVRDHGGQIAVESRVGQGTTFKVQLPACCVAAEDRLKALVAHRDATERDYVAAALTGWGHTVAAVESAGDARARLEAGGFDVALLDASLIGAEPAAWNAALTSGTSRTTVILMTDTAESEGIAPPYELSALRSALRGVSKEYV
jgi:signal transduction histidine kinase/DNA-binding response OmpR family regulator